MEGYRIYTRKEQIFLKMLNNTKLHMIIVIDHILCVFPPKHTWLYSRSMLLQTGQTYSINKRDTKLWNIKIIVLFINDVFIWTERYIVWAILHFWDLSLWLQWNYMFLAFFLATPSWFSLLLLFLLTELFFLSFLEFTYY